MDNENKIAHANAKKATADIWKRRAELAFHHPITTRKVLMATPPIHEMFRVINRVVMLRDTGCCFVGPSGTGKTSALIVIEAMIKVRWPTLYVVRHHTHNNKVPSIRAFFKHFLSTLKHPERKGETIDLRQRLVNWLADEALLSGLNLVLLTIDEAQAMDVADFEFLKDVYNDLAEADVQLVTVLMAQSPDFDAVVTKLRHQRRLDLIGRFAMRIVPFRAYNSLEDITAILEFIDQAIYPEDSGITWTAFYFPEAFANGFRISSQSEKFYSAIAEITPGAKPSEICFPARQAFLAIKFICNEYAGYDSPELQLPNDAWNFAVQYAMIKEAMEAMPEGSKRGAHGEHSHTISI